MSLLLAVIWPFLRSVMIGATVALIVSLAYSIIHRFQMKQGLVGIDVIRLEVCYSPMFWVLVCVAFGVSAFLSLRVVPS